MLQTIWALVGLGGLLWWCIGCWPVFAAMLRPRLLSRVSAEPTSGLPGAPILSVVVPACNEETAIRRCLDSILAQDFSRLEVIAVNDRSADATGTIMDDVAARDPRLRVVHISELPPGWLGKNHANQVGSVKATGDWLLFTDGDILFDPGCIRRAVAFAEIEKLDHLSLLPRLICHGYWEKAVCCFFGLILMASLKPWHVRNPLRPRSFCGIGAFNLVRRSVHRAIGGHEPLRLEVGDDLKLAKLLKRAGFVSDLLDGWPLLTVRWQVGLRGVIRGLEKNAFCGANYRTGRALLGGMLLVFLALAPPLGSLLSHGWMRLPFAAWWAGQILLLAIAARAQGFSWTIGLSFPIACLTIAYALVRSTILALWRGGVSWRGTFYALTDLRRGLV